MTDGIGYSNSATLNRIGGRKCIDGWMDAVGVLEITFSAGSLIGEF